LTRPNSLRLFRQLMSTCELVFTLCVSTDRGPVANSSSRFSACGSDGDEAVVGRRGRVSAEERAIQRREPRNETLAAGMTVRQRARASGARRETRQHDTTVLGTEPVAVIARSRSRGSVPLLT
jgi:hypothetical protein